MPAHPQHRQDMLTRRSSTTDHMFTLKLGIVALLDRLRYPCYTCARVNVGTYLVGDGMGAGTLVLCQWRIIKGRVSTRKLRPIRVRDGNHDRTVSRLDTFILYSLTGTAVVEISNRRGPHRICLVRRRNGEPRTILKEHL